MLRLQTSQIMGTGKKPTDTIGTDPAHKCHPTQILFNNPKGRQEMDGQYRMKAKRTQAIPATNRRTQYNSQMTDLYIPFSRLRYEPSSF